MSTSTRSIRDYVHRAFFARDKATLAAVADEAEHAFPPDVEKKEGSEEEEGDDKDHSGHHGGVHVHIEHGKQDDTADKAVKAADARIKKIEDSVAALSKAVSRVADAVGVKVKDQDEPNEQSDEERLANLRKARAAQGSGGEASEGGDKDDDDDNKEKTADTDPDSGEAGATEAELLKKIEPDLMDADPSLRTGRSDMGDRGYAKRVKDAFALVVKDATARAEVLHPGTRLPTIDHTTMDAAAATRRLCAFRRGALLGALKSENGRKAMGKYTGDDVKGMSCDAVRVLFDDASTKMWHLNNDSAREVNTDAFRPNPNTMRAYRHKQTEQLAAINATNREFWAKQSGRPN